MTLISSRHRFNLNVLVCLAALESMALNADISGGLTVSPEMNRIINLPNKYIDTLNGGERLRQLYRQGMLARVSTRHP